MLQKLREKDCVFFRLRMPSFNPDVQFFRWMVLSLSMVVALHVICVNSARASAEVDIILQLLMNKGLITQEDADQARMAVEQARVADKTEVKVEVKEELSEEGLPLFSGGRFKVYGSLDVGGYSQTNTNFTDENSVSFMENVAKIGVLAHVTESVDADIRIVAANTAGDDEQFFSTASDDVKTYLDIANLTIKAVMGTELNLIIGRQEMIIGDGFLIGDGRLDTVAQWISPLKSFDAVRGTLNQDAWTYDIFAAHLDNDWVQWLGDGTDQIAMTSYSGGGQLVGFNVNYESEDCGIWDVGFFYRNDNSELHNDTLAQSLKGQYDIPVIPGLTLSGEFVSQLGSTYMQEGNLLTGHKIDRRSFGGHMDVTYAFQDVPFNPFITASYIYLPGDDPDTPGRNEGFDPLFFDGLDWGKWYLGNIVGGNQVINTNALVTVLEFGLIPTSSTQLRVQFFNTRLAQGLDGYSRTNFSNELNLIFDYWPNEIFYSGFSFGVAHPLEAAKYWNADSDTGEEADENIFEIIAWAGIEF